MFGFMELLFKGSLGLAGMFLTKLVLKPVAPAKQTTASEPRKKHVRVINLSSVHDHVT